MDHGDLLAGVPLFEGLSDSDRAELGERLREESFAVGECVFKKGDPGSSMYLILSGAVQIYLPAAKDTPRVVLNDLRTGEYFGELSLFDSKPRSASVDAVVKTILLKLTREDFTGHLVTSKGASLVILGEMAERLRKTNAMLGQRATTNAVKEIEENLTWDQRLADKVAALNGSWSFILFILALTFAWSAINLFPRSSFDPYPYILYNLAISILVAMQGPLIVMSQNRRMTKDRAKAGADFRVNLKNEVGVEAIVHELAAFRAQAEKRLQGLEHTLFRPIKKDA